MIRYTVLACALLVTLSACAWNAAAAIIDFELDPVTNLPHLPAVDNTPLAAPYNITGGGTVTFYFDVTGGPDQPGIFEFIGVDGNDGFVNTVLGVNDTAMPIAVGQLGNWFLRQVTPGTVPPPFIIQYNTLQTITAMSGEIWDIDGQVSATEQWLVEVLDSSNTLLASTLSPLGNNQLLDGLPWTFAFTGLPIGVDKVRLTFVGSKQGGLGLAFNNFSPTLAVPEPSSIALLTFGSLGAVLFARRTRKS